MHKPLFAAGLGLNYGYSITQSSRIVTGLNFHTKGEKLSVKWEDLTFPDNINPFYGFVQPTNVIPTDEKKLLVATITSHFKCP